MEHSECIKVAVVDDHILFRKGIVMVVNKMKNIQVVAEADNGRMFLDTVGDAVFDVVLMDIKMPEMDGVEATKAAVEKRPDLKVIALSMFGEEEYLQKMLEAGVKGFILKKNDIDSLEMAIRTVAGNNSYYAPELLPFFTKKFLSPPKEEKDDQLQLTKRELEVLSLVAQGKSNQEIADELFISIRTVDGHKTNLITKTGSKNIVALLIYAIRNNLVSI